MPGSKGLGTITKWQSVGTVAGLCSAGPQLKSNRADLSRDEGHRTFKAEMGTVLGKLEQWVVL